MLKRFLAWLAGLVKRPRGPTRQSGGGPGPPPGGH